MANWFMYSTAAEFVPVMDLVAEVASCLGKQQGPPSKDIVNEFRTTTTVSR